MSQDGQDTVAFYVVCVSGVSAVFSAESAVRVRTSVRMPQRAGGALGEEGSPVLADRMYLTANRRCIRLSPFGIGRSSECNVGCVYEPAPRPLCAWPRLYGRAPIRCSNGLLPCEAKHLCPRSCAPLLCPHVCPHVSSPYFKSYFLAVGGHVAPVSFCSFLKK